MRRYSRLITVQEKKHRRQAVFWVFLTIILIAVLLFWGIPTLAKFSSYLSDLKGNQTIDPVDKIAPAPPLFSIQDATTNNPQFNISGSGEGKSKLILFHNGKQIEIQIGDDGKFSYDTTLLEDENTFSGKIKDQAGNESQMSGEYKIMYDTSPPELEIIEPQEGQSFQGSGEQNLTLRMKTNEQATVKVNDRLATELVDAASGDKEYSSQTKLSEGSNSFNIKALDEAGNETEKTITVTYYP